MRKALLAFVTLAIGVYVAALVVPIDPDERRPGTRLSGSVASAPSNWAERVQPRMQVYVQTRTWYGIPHAVTTVSFTLDGDLYVPCARCDTKRWPRNVARDPNVVVKVGEALYQRKAVRVEDARILERIFRGRWEPGGDLWLFRMEPRD